MGNKSLKAKEYIQLYPLVPVAISLIVGIVVGEHIAFSYTALLAATLFIVAIIVLFNSVRRSRYLISSCHLLFVCTLGIFITKWTDDQLKFTETDGYDTFHVIVKSEPIEKDDGIVIEVKAVDGRLEGKNIRLHIIGSNSVNMSDQLLGKCLSVKAKVRHPKHFPTSNFDYPLYLKSHGILAVATVYPTNWKITGNEDYSLSPIDNIKIFFLSKRRLMVRLLRSIGMDNQDFAVAAAMSLGDKSDISRATSNAYSLAGTSHILALSGLHLSIVFGLFAVFGGTWRRSIAMVVISLLAIWMYVLLAGSPVSMIRSAIMLSISLLVGLSGRNGLTLNTLSFSAIIILMANPFAIHDVGFQLSFAAVAFLGTFASGISNLLPNDIQWNHRFLKWCWQMVVTSTVAQMGTTPLIAYHFGRIPILFLPANFVAIPAATVMLYLIVAFFLLAWIPLASQIIGQALSMTTSLLNTSMTWIASQWWSSLTIECLNAIDVIGLYALIIIILTTCLRGNKLSIKTSSRHMDADIRSS